MKLPVAGKHLQFSADKIQPLLLFLMGMGFLVLGMRIYPAFIAVGSLFMLVGYRGYTYRPVDTTTRPD